MMSSAKSPMIRVLQVYKDYYPVLGGIENHVKLLAERLARRDDTSVRVLVTALGRHSQVETIEGVEVIKAARLATVASTPISLSLFGWMGQLEADVTHLHFPYPVGEMAYLMRGRSPRLVITYHSDVVRQRGLLRLYRPFLERVLARADRIIATSPHYIRSSPFLERHAAKCVVIPSCVDLERFARVDEARVAQIRARFRPPLILFVGRFRYYKGLSYLIEAMKEVSGTALLVGTGPLEGELRRQVAEAGLDERVAFLGEVPEEELPAYYQAAELFVLPAVERSEAFGLTQVEAMACGVPCVATEVGTGTSWVNLHGQTGLIVPPRDAAALAAAINQILGNEAFRQTLGEAARRRAHTEFGVDSMVERIVEVYREVLG